MHVKICRKEAKESGFWLRLVDTGTEKSVEAERQCLVGESTQLMKIFGKILSNSE